MPTKPNEEPDLNLVSKWLASCNLETARFSKLETHLTKTPDFRVAQNGKLVAFCEVKSPNDPWLDNQLSQASEYVIVGGARRDPVFDRLARLINKAVKQFDAVNSDRKALNVLSFVNHDRASRMRDLIEVLTGHFQADSGERIPTMLNLSERIIGDSKWIVDIYLWFDARKPSKPFILFNSKDDERKFRACKMLGILPSQIKYTAKALR